MNNIWLMQPIREWLPIKWYGGVIPGLPDLCVGKLPAAFGKFGVEAWKVWYVETPAENIALHEALSKPVPLRGNSVDFASGPDAVVSKADPTKHYGESIVTLYAPDETDNGWPWITVFRLPSVAAAGPMSHQLGRGVYAYEIDMSEEAAMTRFSRMQRMTLAAGCAPEVVHPDRTTSV